MNTMMATQCLLTKVKGQEAIKELGEQWAIHFIMTNIRTDVEKEDFNEKGNSKTSPLFLLIYNPRMNLSMKFIKATF